MLYHLVLCCIFVRGKSGTLADEEALPHQNYIIIIIITYNHLLYIIGRESWRTKRPSCAA